MPDVNLQIVHPEYHRMYDAWAEAWDFYRGGRWVLDPRRFIQTIDFLAPSEESPDNIVSEPSRRTALYAPTPVRSYLHSHARENKSRFAARNERGVHFPLFRSLIDIYVSATMRTPPKRNDGEKLQEPWTTYHNDVDMRGTNINAFIRQSLA
jgi:hypothetical protein